MAIAAVQRKSKGAVATSVAIGSGDGWATPTSGNLLVASANSDSTVTMSGWTAGPSVVDGNGAYVFYKISAGTESTITATPSGSADIVLTVAEYSGNTAIPFDVSNTSTIASSSGTVTTSTSVTTTASADLIIAVAALHSLPGAVPSAPSWANSFTNVLSDYSGAASASTRQCYTFVAELLPAGAAGAYSTSASWTGPASDRQQLIIAFKAAAGGSTVNGSATLASTSSLTAAASVVRAGTATLASTSSLTAAGALIRPGQATAASSSTLTASGSVVLAGNAGLASASTLAGAATVTVNGTATLASSSALTASAAGTQNGTATLTSASSFTAAGNVLAAGAAALASTSALTAAGTARINGTATLASTSVLTGNTTGTVPGTATLTSTSALAATGTTLILAGAGLASTSALTGTASLTVRATAVLVSASSLTAVIGTVNQPGRLTPAMTAASLTGADRAASMTSTTWP